MCPEGQDLIPNESCKCAPFSQIQALFPKWASFQEVQFSFMIGIQQALNEDAKQEPEEKEDDGSK